MNEYSVSCSLNPIQQSWKICEVLMKYNIRLNGLGVSQFKLSRSLNSTAYYKFDPPKVILLQI